MKFTSAFLIALLNAPGLLAVGVSPSDGNSSLAKRDCWFGKPVGCTNGFCWKTCGNKGDGTWVWMLIYNWYSAGLPTIKILVLAAGNGLLVPKTATAMRTWPVARMTRQLGRNVKTVAAAVKRRKLA
ncbi:hypothetical protein K435DRAFT_799753 [Dendrothele bispora CBS 962.96]|uniref:CBM1 domain-containing protein n=1 Tax=Dendrothele bispora (strain CBS 962.96) TaxID=1314807 RepID=A0A4S8LW82_DENBC|nr:hypothetical protein K435DRAFT_799753 [Dendrothele bispora CBS 962.96]